MQFQINAQTLMKTYSPHYSGMATAQTPARVKRVKTFLVRSRRDYCGSCLYADGELERILTESGWYSPGGSYTATVNDHQGNLRSTLTKSYSTPPASTDLAGGSGTAGSGDLAGDLGAAGGTIGSGGVIGIGGGTIGGGIVEPQKPRLRYANLTAYSPYGLPLADWQGEERYLYSGKELDRTGGLMLYDFHARQYDPQLGRFTSPDPLQSQSPGISPYLYCSANPISRIDPSGMTDYFNEKGSYVYSENPQNTDRVLVFTSSKKEAEVKQYVKDLKFIVAPSKEVIEAMDNVYKRTDATGEEHGFRVGDKGSVSEIIHGNKNTIENEDWTDAITDITSKGERTEYDVHSHPPIKANEFDGTELKYNNVPSSTDMENFIGTAPNVVLGYKMFQEYRSPNVIGGSPGVTVEKCIRIFNRNGSINSDDYKYSTFKNAVKNIYKWKPKESK